MHATRCTCSDGRIDSLKANAEPAIRLPGTTVLVPESEWPRQAEKFRALGITTLDSHEDCGAAGKAFAAAGMSGGKAAVESYAEERVRAFCVSQGFTYGRHIPISDMASAHHDEADLYYDATDVGEQKFEVASSSLPRGFVLTEAAALNPHGYLLALIGIAFGPHGSAAKAFEEGKKFTVHIIANEAKIEAKISEIQRAIEGSEFVDKVVVVPEPLQ